MPGIKKWLSKSWKAVMKPCANQQELDSQKESDQQTKLSVSSASSSSQLTVASDNVQLVTEWMEAWTLKDLEKVVTMSVERCEYHVPLEDGEVMHVRLNDFLEQMKLCYASFPDYTSSWEAIEDGDEPNSVIIKKFISTGTHTGEPFAFGPFPAMPAKGNVINDDPICLKIWLEDGKVHHTRTVLDGGQMGPALYYTQVGGMII